MKVIIDTCVWSLAFRRQVQPINSIITTLKELIIEKRVEILGAIRQELLSGIIVPAHFEKLKLHLRAFPNLELDYQDFELAAEYFNTLRSPGIQGSNTDFLICAVSIRRNMSIYTTDNDFQLFSQHIPIKLLSID